MGKRKDSKFQVKISEVADTHFKKMYASSMDAEIKKKQKIGEAVVETIEEFLARGGIIKQYDMNGKEVTK